MELKDILSAFSRIPTLVNALLQQANLPAQRALLVTQTLRAVWPSSPLYACQLLEGSQSHLAALDAVGNARPEWAEKLAKEMAPADGKANRRGKTPARLLQSLKLTDHTLTISPLTFQDHSFGSLALALPRKAVSDEDTLGRMLLTACADELARRLDQEGQPQEGQEELTAQTALADIAELAGPLSHEFNDFLHMLLLHLAVLEPQVTEQLRSDLAEVRRQAAGITALIKQFQQYRRRQQPTATTVDLNRIVADVVASHPSGVAVRMELAPHLPRVQGTTTDLKRLVTFLLRNAEAAAGPSGSVTLQTESAAEKVLLRVQDTGPSIEPDLLPKLFDAGTLGREGSLSLELAACKSLVKRCHGKIDGANGTEEGVVITVELPVQLEMK